MILSKKLPKFNVLGLKAKAHVVSLYVKTLLTKLKSVTALKPKEESVNDDAAIVKSKNGTKLT